MYGNFQQPQQMGFNQPNGYGVPTQQNDWPTNQTLLNPSSFNFSPQNHPPVRFELLAQEIAPLIPVIASSIANEICQTAYKNTIRVYTFNQLSANNFMNPDFNQVVQLAADALSTIVKRRGPGGSIFNPQVDVPRECSNALYIKCSSNVTNSQALAQTIDPMLGRDVQAVMESYKNTIVDINHLRVMVKNQYRGQIPIYDSNSTNFQGYQQQGGFVHPQTANHFANNQSPSYGWGNPNPSQAYPNHNQANHPRPSWGNPEPVNQMERKSFEPTKVQIIQNVNGQLTYVQDQTPVQNFNQNQENSNTIRGSRFSPPPQREEWNSSPAPIQQRSGLPQGCPPPEQEKVHQDNHFKMPEIRESGFTVPQPQNSFVDEERESLLSGIKPEFVNSGFPIEEVPIEIGENAKWTPVPLQPFILCHSFLTQKIVIKKISYKGRFYYIQQVKQQTEAEMDELRHRIAPNTARDRAYMEILAEERAEISMREEGLEEGRVVTVGDKVAGFAETPEQKLAESILSGETEKKFEVPKLSTLSLAGIDRDAVEKTNEDGSAAWMDVGFVNDAIHTTRLRHHAMSNSKSRILRGRYLVPKTFICKKEIASIFDSVVKEKSFIAVSDKINSIIGSSSVGRSVREFICEFDNYLTDLVNDFLKNSLNAGYIDSFSEDISTLVGGHLLRTNGPEVHAAFLNFEKAFFDRYLTRIADEEAISVLKESFVDEEDDASESKPDEVFVLALENNYTVTSVRVHSSEMKIPVGIPVNGALIYHITEDHKELLKFCMNLFESFAKETYQWRSHLLLTIDGKIFSVEKSVFDDSRFVLRHFNANDMLP